MAENRRKKSIEAGIQRELGKLLLIYPKESPLNKVTITLVDVAPDLSMAKVFFLVFSESDLEEAKKTLKNEAKHLRKSLARNLNLRATPRLEFVYDESIMQSMALSDLIDRAVISDGGKSEA